MIVIDQNPQRISQKEAFLKVPKSEIPYPKLTRVVCFHVTSKWLSQLLELLQQPKLLNLPV